MSCVEYLKNFYNDHEFKVAEYSPVLPSVVFVSSKMLRSMFAINQCEIVNEVLELFRFIVDKYSSNDIMMDSNTSVVQYIINLMREIFNSIQCFTGDQSLEAPREQVIGVQTILRIMLQIVVHVPV